MNTFKTSVKNISQTPRKTGIVATLIRRRSIEDALVILEHTPRRAAQSFSKLLKNAQVIAKSRKLDPKTLQIEEVFVVTGSSFNKTRRDRHAKKSLRKISAYKKRSSHIFLTVKGDMVVSKKQAVAAKGEVKK